jgi:flagellar biosynthesis/type III secretory pathway protein FliH
MTVREKAEELALTLLGEDQNPEPVIKILIEMAEWQREQVVDGNMLLPFREYDNLMDSINRQKKAGYEAGYKAGLEDGKEKQHDKA